MRIFLLFSSLFISSAAFASNTGEARQTIKAFSTDLKQVLVSTMKQSGPLAAISVCNTAAPAIASQHSNSPWQISRSALKTRNSDNQPDAWLKNVLLNFEQRKLNGEPVASIEYQEQRPDGWYFVKAIPTQKACLACHGSDIAPAVSKKIATLYPNDQANDFKLGDIRGAFVVKKAIENHQ
ncbi:DUF3365 domain-containing protein [Pseudoalteromonas sp. SK18]|uniref:Tll0287-like domain-containing protein n=1 Tax=Pseudoalteromonas sp. SK18 TaxID=1938366 RepID=UPI0009757028|nr:DUF3365 domain-containing protein [Pseudoalteromonas sp. SK18]